jgi:hypothetical protein
MSQTLEDYYRKLQTEADALAREAEAHSCFDHLHAFNFGRSLGCLFKKGRDHELSPMWCPHRSK